MKRGLPFLLAALELACNANENAAVGKTALKPPASASAKALTPHASLPPPALPHGRHDPALAQLLSKLAYKPDPYETQPGCISEPQSQQRNELILWAQISLTHDAQGEVAVKEASYSVSTTSTQPGEELAESVGIPRLELVHRDGSSTRTDFEGSYREPRSPEVRRASEITPADPTWVLGWLAHAQITEEVIAHRIVLNGKVLKEVKRPDEGPRLGNIECDDTQAEGLKLSWRATLKDAQAPLLVEVMRLENRSFIELLPTTAAREVQGFTILSADRKVSEDLVLLVTLTDTFRFITRGVLVPRKAL